MHVDPSDVSPRKDALGLMWQRYLDTNPETEPPNADRERAKQWAARSFAEFVLDHLEELKRLEDGLAAYKETGETQHIEIP